MTVIVAQDWIDRTAGSYQLLVEIGRGRTGVVFLGEHVQTRSRAAVKIIPPGNAAEAVLACAGTLVALDHPHLVRVLECGRVGDCVYMACACVAFSPQAQAGTLFTRSLDEHVHDQASLLPERFAAGIVADLLDALAYTHGHAGSGRPLAFGGMHPRNVLLEETAGGVSARLGDVGMPVARERRIAADAYLSPEELQGAQATEASDVYALGALAYLLLTGMAPPSPLVPPNEVRQDIQPRWDELIRRSLAYDVQKRFAGYAEMQRALLDLRAAMNSRWPLRHMRVALFTNALVGALVVVAVATVIYYRSHAVPPAPPPTPPAQAVQPSADVPPVPQDSSIIVIEKGQKPPARPGLPTAPAPAGTAAAVPPGIHGPGSTSLLDTSSGIAIAGAEPTNEAVAAIVPPPAPSTAASAVSTTAVMPQSGSATVARVAPVPRPVSTAPAPPAAEPRSVPALSAAGTTEYVVRSGDSLWQIARAHKMQFAALVELNQLGTNYALHAGQKLLVAHSSAAASNIFVAPPATTAPAAVPRVAEYRVKQGDNYYSIARKLGCNVKELQSLNNNKKLIAGQTIRVPASP